MNNNIENKRTIMTYPFTGFDYKQIVDICDRIKLKYYNNGIQMKYVIPYTCSENNIKQQRIVVVTDEKVKCTLYYFKFLKYMCRSKKVSINNNAYIDAVLITLNEIMYSSGHIDVNNDFNEVLGRFQKKKMIYKYFFELYNFLCSDSYKIHFNKTEDVKTGVSFVELQSGMIGDIVNSIITNKDNIDELNFNNVQTSGPQLTKKISKSQVI